MRGLSVERDDREGPSTIFLSLLSAELVPPVPERGLRPLLNEFPKELKPREEDMDDVGVERRPLPRREEGKRSVRPDGKRSLRPEARSPQDRPLLPTAVGVVGVEEVTDWRVW